MIRVILAAMIAFSVAMLPAVGGAAVASKSSAASMSDPGSENGMPCDKAIGDCKTFAGCALKCFNFLETIAPELWPPASNTEPSFVAKAFRSHMNTPPFRPPPM